MLKVRIFLLIMSVSTLGLVGCAKIEESDKPLTDLTPAYKTVGAEIVSGTVKDQETLINNFKVPTEVGKMSDQIQATTPKGYKVSIGINSGINSDNE